MRPQHTVLSASTQEGPPSCAAPDDLAGPFEVTLAGGPDAPADARAAVSAWMAGHVSEAMLADAQLLVVELVANSIRHAEVPGDAVIRVCAQIRAGVVRLEVEDRGRTGSIVRRAPDPQGEGGGFGLNVVAMLSARWGVNRDVGTCVWAELALPAG